MHERSWVYGGSNGVTLHEYVLIASVVAIAALPAIVNMSGVLGLEVAGMGGILASGNTPAIVSTNIDNGSSQLTVDISQLGQGGPINLSYHYLPGGIYSSGAIANEIEVAGSSGGIDKIAAIIEGLANQLQADGADPNTVADLLGLANKGYALADKIQYSESGVMENIAMGSDPSLTAQEKHTRAVNNINRDDGVDVFIVDFIVKFMEIEAHLNTSDPELEVVVDALANEIIKVGNNFSVIMSEYKYQHVLYEYSMYENFDPNILPGIDTINRHASSTLIHGNSQEIEQSRWQHLADKQNNDLQTIMDGGNPEET